MAAPSQTLPMVDGGWGGLQATPNQARHPSKQALFFPNHRDTQRGNCREVARSFSQSPTSPALCWFPLVRPDTRRGDMLSEVVTYASYAVRMVSTAVDTRS